MNFIKIANPATFGTTAKKLVIEVGAPSYTSGVHIWNGTAETLNARPTRMNTIANIEPTFSLLSCSAINSKLVDPVKPYNKEQPYSNKPDDKALNTKYFIPDSDDFKLSLSIEAKMYRDNDCNSNPI